MHVWRINTRSHEFNIEPVPVSWERLGGRGLIARILLDEVPPTCDPLGPKNKLLFCPGLLVGHMLTSCDRLSVGGKSPLTGGVKEANSGGTTAYDLVMLGIKAMILEDKPENPEWQILHITSNGVHFESASEYYGLGVYSCTERLLQNYGTGISIALIGPAGERGYLAAGIMNLDKDHIPTRINARGGLGALMGSKFIKAIIIHPQGGHPPEIIDSQGFKNAQKTFTKVLMEHPQTAIYRDYGTPGVARMCNSFGALPTRAFSEGEFEEIEKIAGETFRQVILERKGEPTHACMPGCIIQCSNKFVDKKGFTLVAPLEYETIGLMGSNLGIGDLDIIARLNWIANDVGLDTIDTGAALGIAARAGLLSFGDGNRALELMHEISKNTDLGRVLGNGAAHAGEKLGIKEVPVVKRQALSAYDPRAIKGTGITYATSPQGGDHTAGLTIRAKVDHLNPQGQVDISRNAQINMAGYDTLGACIFAGFGFAASPDSLKDLINAKYGWNIQNDFLQVLGRNTLSLELEFNCQAGFSKKDDRLPEWMKETPLPPTGAVFDVTDSDLDEVFNW